MPILEEVILLRQKEAKLLGYESHADYILAVKMAKNPENVRTFRRPILTYLGSFVPQRFEQEAYSRIRS